jgi:hypothetical protein
MADDMAVAINTKTLVIDSTIRVMDLVRVVQFAPNQFDRVFKNSFGCTPVLSK